MRNALGALVGVAVLGLMAAGCAGDAGPGPTSPTTVVSQSSVPVDPSDARALVALKGIIRGLDAEKQLFALVRQTDTGAAARRAIRMDDRTEVWAGDRRVTRRALTDGMAVEVRGLDAGRFVIARRIVILRRAAG